MASQRERVDALIADRRRLHNAATAYHRRQRTLRLEEAQRALAEIAKHDARLLELEEDLRGQLAKIRAMAKDPLVLVRSYGTVSTYHGSRRCGWAGSGSNVTELLLTEALERGLHPCSSCGYMARSAA